jgi:hypothetical protein
MLLYKGGEFMQVLEGPDRTVRSLVQSITTDPRHFGLVTLIEEPIADREYPDWAMAFHNLNSVTAKDVPGYAEFEPLALTGVEFHSDPALAQKLLRLFRGRL